MQSGDHITTAQTEKARELRDGQAPVCDICGQPIKAGERFHDDGSEIAHTACVGNWFRSNWGRESLR